jgi:hypothetical protein
MSPSSTKRKRGNPGVDHRDSFRYSVAKIYEQQIAEREAGLGKQLRRGKGYFRAAVVAVLTKEGITDPAMVNNIWKRLAHTRRHDDEHKARMSEVIRFVRDLYRTVRERRGYVRCAASMLRFRQNQLPGGLALPWNERDFALMCKQASADPLSRKQAVALIAAMETILNRQNSMRDFS